MKSLLVDSIENWPKSQEKCGWYSVELGWIIKFCLLKVIFWCNEELDPLMEFNVPLGGSNLRL